MNTFILILLYNLSVALKLPVAWQVWLLPKKKIVRNICRIPLSSVKWYSTCDPSPPKGSWRFCFAPREETGFLPYISIFDEMTSGDYRACVHNSIRKIFLEDADPKTTSQYHRMVSNVESGQKPYGCHSLEDIDIYFDQLRAVYKSIQKNGFKSQQELGQNVKDEVRVHVTSNGEFCLGSKGNHRFRLAELCGTTSISCILYGANINFVASLAEKTSLAPHIALSDWMETHGAISSSP